MMPGHFDVLDGSNVTIKMRNRTGRKIMEVMAADVFVHEILYLIYELTDFLVKTTYFLRNNARGNKFDVLINVKRRTNIMQQDMQRQ